jgi:hypothetical protein
LIPSIHLSELKYVIKINPLPETSPRDLKKENDYYKTGNVNVSYDGKYIYLTLCTFTFELRKVSCLIQDVVSTYCGDKRMARTT